MPERPPKRYSSNHVMAKNYKELALGQKIVDGKIASPMRFDADRLLVSRALITSSSGGGKSYLLRRMLEVLSKVFPLIVFDPEGEFSSLRQIVDLVLVGPDGDIPADPSTAAMLCRHLVENRVSAVIDLNELPPTSRKEYVANFLNAMLDLPKKFWTPYIVAIDEVHEFCSNDKTIDDCKTAVELLYSKGRKRGFCGLSATQRVEKCSPNLTAEAKTRLIGQITYDNDLRRASDFLGWGKQEWHRLRDLSPPGREGEFYAVGPALCDRGVVLFRGDKVQTHHPRPGEGSTYRPPQPSAKLSGVLGELRSLPAKVAEEKVTIESLTKKNHELTRTVKDLNRIATTKALPSAATGSRIDPGTVRRLTEARKLLETAMGVIKKQAEALASPPGLDADKVQSIVTTAVSTAVKAVNDLHGKANAGYQAGIRQIQADAKRLVDSAAKLLGRSESVTPDVTDDIMVGILDDDDADPVLPPDKPKTGAVKPPRTAVAGSGDASLGKGERIVLIAIANAQSGSCTRSELTIMTGYKKSSRDAYVARLRNRSYVEGKADELVVTDAGLVALGDKYEPLPTGDALAAHWLKKLGDGGEYKILKHLIDVYPEKITRETIGDATGYLKSSRDAYLARLATRKLITSDKDGVQASSILFD